MVTWVGRGVYRSSYMGQLYLTLLFLVKPVLERVGEDVVLWLNSGLLLLEKGLSLFSDDLLL